MWGSTFWDFWRILRRVGQHFVELFEDFTSCEEHFFELLADLKSCGAALFGAFGGFNVVWGSTFWSPSLRMGTRTSPLSRGLRNSPRRNCSLRQRVQGKL